MKDIVTTIKGYVNDLIQLSLSLIAFGAVMGILFPGGMFGMDVIGNVVAISDEPAHPYHHLSLSQFIFPLVLYYGYYIACKLEKTQPMIVQLQDLNNMELVSVRTQEQQNTSPVIVTNNSYVAPNAEAISNKNSTLLSKV